MANGYHTGQLRFRIITEQRWIAARDFKIQWFVCIFLVGQYSKAKIT